MPLYCVGDIHGKFPELAQVLKNLPTDIHAVCVGDIGLGFPDSDEPSCLAAVDAVARERNQQVWLMRGNHDNPDIWLRQKSYWNSHLTHIRIPDDVYRIKIDNIHVIMVGGAISLDRTHTDRIDDLTWWKHEAVSPASLQKVRQLVGAYGRADILITHAGPYGAQPPLSRDQASFDHYAKEDPQLASDVKAERILLAHIVEASQARTVAFGHYHVPLESHNGPIRYRCCAELEAWQYIKRSVLPPMRPKLPTL